MKGFAADLDSMLQHGHEVAGFAGVVGTIETIWFSATATEMHEQTGETLLL